MVGPLVKTLGPVVMKKILSALAKRIDKTKYGSVVLESRTGVEWKIRVRKTTPRGRYLKIRPKGAKSPEQYLHVDREISRDEWDLVRGLVAGRPDYRPGPDDPEELVAALHDLVNAIERA